MIVIVDGVCDITIMYRAVWSEAKDAERSRGQLKMTPDRKRVVFILLSALVPIIMSSTSVFSGFNFDYNNDNDTNR